MVFSSVEVTRSIVQFNCRTGTVCFKKSLPNSYSKLLYKEGQDFLDISMYISGLLVYCPGHDITIKWQKFTKVCLSCVTNGIMGYDFGKPYILGFVLYLNDLSLSGLSVLVTTIPWRRIVLDSSMGYSPGPINRIPNISMQTEMQIKFIRKITDLGSGLREKHSITSVTGN